MRYLLILVVVSITFIISSCKKDNSTPATATCHLTKVLNEVTGEPVNFLYNGTNLTRIIQTDRGYIQFTYKGSNIDSAKSYDASSQLKSYYHFFYSTDGKLTSVESWDQDSNNPGTFVQQSLNGIQYSGNNISRVNTYDYPNNPTTVKEYTDYTYDAKGNATSSSEYQVQSSVPVLMNKYDYSYDDKKSVYTFPSTVLLMISQAPAVNNVITLTRTQYPAVTSKKDSTVYSYDGNSYPTKATQYSSNGSVGISSFTYDCN